jgi:hypothetical protein
LRLFERSNEEIRLVSKVIGPLQIRLLHGPLGLLEKSARPFQSAALGGREPFAAEMKNSLLDLLLQLDHLSLQCCCLA